MYQIKGNIDHSEPNPTLYNLPFEVDDFNDMPFRNLGKSGLRVPNVGLGTWKIGYPQTGDRSRVNERDAFQLFDRAIELGVILWDTANRYNNASGNSERIIGKWMRKNTSQRRNVIVSTKLGGVMDGITPNHCGLSRKNIRESVYASLERLQTDYIDLLYFHAFDTITPIEESLATIEDLVRQDMVRYFSVSNFTVDQMDSYKTFEQNFSIRSRIVAVQNQFDILHGECAPYNGVLEYALRMGISYVAWSPLAKGLLTERYLDLANIGKGDRLYDEERIRSDSNIPGMGKLYNLAKLAQEWGMKLSQLVLSYMLSLPGMGPVIPTSSNITQLKLNAEAGKIILSEEQIKEIKEIVP